MCNQILIKRGHNIVGGRALLQMHQGGTGGGLAATSCRAVDDCKSMVSKLKIKLYGIAM